MHHRRLGRTALAVSDVGLGTMSFASLTDEQGSHAILDRAVERGVNLIDTADQYGGSAGTGAAESVIGRWLASRPGRRDEIVVATKVHEPMSDDVNDRGLSAYHIRRACEASLRRLQTDHIDLYQMHHIDRAAPWDEIWQAMDVLIGQGKISYVGSSNFAGWHIAAANEAAARRTTLGVVAEQSLYNLTERTVELEVVPACAAYGVGLLPWSPLAGGVLAAEPGTGGRRRQDPAVRTRVEALGPALTAWFQLCRDLGEPPSVVAIAWLMQRPGVTAPIIGARTLEQLDALVPRVREVTLEDDVLARLDAIFPGPGGPAPEAYAW